MTAKPIAVTLEYPRVEGHHDRVVIELEDVRSADNLEVSYDFERDGWVLRMDLAEDKGDRMDIIEERVEVGFLPAWNVKAGTVTERAQLILNHINAKVSEFLYYDRKECEDLPIGSIDEAVREDEIDIEQMVSVFRDTLQKGLKR